MADGWLLRRLSGQGFAALVFGDAQAARVLRDAADGPVPLQVVELDATGLAAERYDARPGTVVLLRPDQHVCARWRHATPADLRAALHRALALQ